MYRSLAVIAAAVLPTTLFADKTLVWQKQTLRDFQAGTLTRLIGTSRDRIQLSRELRPLSDLKVAQVWKLGVDKTGRIWAATSGPGTLQRVDANGIATTVFRDEQQHLFAVAVADDGTVYAGVSPKGAILRIAPAENKPRTLFETGQPYIWALAVDRAGNVWAATGTPGKLFRVSPTGQGKAVFQSRVGHLLSVAVGDSDTAYVGTDKDGLVFRVTPDGKGYVLHDATQPEIHALWLSREGTLYASTASPQRPTLPVSPSLSRPSSGLTTSEPTGPIPPPGGTQADAVQAPKEDRKSDSAAKPPLTSPFGRTRTPAAGSTATVGSNTVYRIEANGTVDELFQDRAMILSLAVLRDRMLVGTGPEGRLFELDLETGEQGQVARLEHGSLNALVRRPDGSLVIAAGSPGKLYVATDRFASTGSYVSDVLDGRMLCRWGRLAWEGDVPAGCRLEFAVRTGNVADPDESWTGWTADPTTLPVGRFAQCKIDFVSPDGAASPSLRKFTLHYTTVNRPPELASIETPSSQAPVAATASSRLTLRWKASDPNDDVLTYQVDIRKDDWPRWITLASDLSSAEFGWEAASFPEGVYQVRIWVNDHKSNRDSEALSASKTSEPFVLDRQPPRVRIVSARSVGERIEVRAEAKDARSRIASGEYSVDGGAFLAAHPDDGLFDAAEETTTVLTGPVKPGDHVVVIRFRDAAGHVGVADRVVSVK